MSVLWRISRKLKRQSFRSDIREWRVPLFLSLCSSFCPLTSPVLAAPSSILTPPSPPFIPFHCPRSVEREWRGSTEPARKSIMKLFKFVSNIEISFMPGKLIIEIYRRTRSWPGSRGMIFLFFARPLFPIARPIRISLHQLSFRDERDERADVPRKQLSFNFAHSPVLRIQATNWRGIVTLKSSL